ncbi:MAG: dihydrofolate reductase [Actinomycetota bacterium]
MRYPEPPETDWHLAHGEVGLIWAQARNNVIGLNGGMPWHLPEDLARFRALTLGATVIMGRRTWESLPERFRPLPNRDNIVLSQNAIYHAPGARICGSVEAALSSAGGDTGIWVIGGSHAYRLAMPFATRVAITDIDLNTPGDAHAPSLDASWQCVQRDPKDGWLDSHSGLRYRFSQHTRVRTPPS